MFNKGLNIYSEFLLTYIYYEEVLQVFSRG